MTNPAPVPTENTAYSPIGNAAFGLFLLVISAGILYFSGNIRALSLGQHDPGPRALPLATGWILLVGGIIQLGQALRSPDLSNAIRKRVQASIQASPIKRLALISGLLVVYAAALSWVGFTLSTSLFLIGVLQVLGSRLWPACLTTAVIVTFITVLFQQVFQVTLPQSAFW